MPTSLNLETARSNDGTLVLTATGEIDLSNIDAFDHALATASLSLPCLSPKHIGRTAKKLAKRRDVRRRT